jgi:hypothetical protein
MDLDGAEKTPIRRSRKIIAAGLISPRAARNRSICSRMMGAKLTISMSTDLDIAEKKLLL